MKPRARYENEFTTRVVDSAGRNFGFGFVRDPME